MWTATREGLAPGPHRRGGAARGAPLSDCRLLDDEDLLTGDSLAAELDGEPLEPTGVQGAAGTWRQAFSVPPGGGELVVAHRSTAGAIATRLIWAVWAVTALAALPLRRKGAIA